MPDYSREELVAELKRRRATEAQPLYDNGQRPMDSEPNVPEWAGRYPNLYGVAGAAYEAVQPFMRGSLVDVGLSKAVGYPTPEFMTEEESMMLPVAGMYVGPSAKGWSGLQGKFSGLADKAERAEISDVGARIKTSMVTPTGKESGEFTTRRRVMPPPPEIQVGYYKSTTVPEILEHPELLKQYPDLKDIQVTLDLNTKRTIQPTGQFAGKNIHIQAKNLQEAKDTLLHEIQHAVQEKEGWARGGSPEEMNREFNNVLIRKQRLEVEPDYIAGQSKINKLWDDVFGSDVSKISNQEAIKREAEIVRAHPVLAEKREVDKKLLQLKNEYGYDAYRRLAGEIESRDTSARAGLTSEQRASTLPYISEDIPLSEWIVKKEGGTSPQYTRAELVEELKRRRQTK